MYHQSNIQQLYVLPTHLYLCFVWIWEQTAIISLYNINCLVFITETQCLLRGTDCILTYNLGSWSLASKREGWVRYQISPCGICERMTLWQVSSQCLRFPLSISVHQCCIIIWLYTTDLPNAWKSSKKAELCQTSVSTWQSRASTLFRLQC